MSGHGPAFLGIAVAIVVILVLLIVLYALSAYRNRLRGGRGFVQRSRLTCPKCHRTFDYTWAPGGSLSAVRLGKYRYFACPLCRKWSSFNVWDAPVPPESGSPPAAPPKPR